jgi:hypothetical protein
MQDEKVMVMTKTNWRQLQKRLEINTRLGEVTPVNPTKLIAFERKHGIKLPQSYRTYCEVFGAGEFAMRFKIAVPGYKRHATTFSLDSLNKMAIEGQEFDVYSKDPEQHKRGIFFCLDILGSFHFFDPAEVTDRRRHEYAIYTVFRDFDLQRTAENYWQFITDCCLGDKHNLLIKGSPKQLFLPVGV